MKVRFLTLATLCILMRSTTLPASEFYFWELQWEGLHTRYRLHEMVLERVGALPFSPRSIVHAASCTPPKTIEQFLRKTSAPKAPKEISSQLLRQPAHSLQNVFEVIRATPLGAQMLKQFLPQFGYEFKIQQFTETEQSQARNRGAIAAYDPLKKILYFDRNAEIGRVAYVVLHEITHALDKEANLAARRLKQFKAQFQQKITTTIKEAIRRTGKPKRELQDPDFNPARLHALAKAKRALDQYTHIRSFKTERLAYDISNQMLYELIRRFPNYYATRSRTLFGSRTLASKPKPLTNIELVRTLRVDPRYIRQYLKGKCQPAGDQLFKSIPP